MNLQVVKNLATGALLKQLNPNMIDITKVPSMPLKNEEEKNHYAFSRQEAIEKQLQRRQGRQVRPTPLFDLENSNDNAFSSEFDDYIGNFDQNVNDQGFKLIVKKLNKTMIRHIRRIWFK
jgi:hypothetical protein